MSSSNEIIRDHYEAAIDDRDALLARLGRMLDGLDGPITAARLAALDQFHVGGLAATAEFARRIGVRSDAVVLDAGSGLGGPSRYLAETFGCRVSGVDLTPAYVAVSTALTARAGLADRVDYRVGDLVELPFEDGSFDLVWTQHVVMNIRDRGRLYREMRRVLKPGGTFAFYDPIAADGHPALAYPVPWAATAATSTLLTQDETAAALGQAGLPVSAWDDVTPMALGWMAEQPQPPPPAVPTMGMIVGPRMGELVANFVRNLKEGRLRLAMGRCTAA